ncbi:MAG: hypothetical protein Q7U28_02680 [Aquabacterium sp.]|nr:hypothetical protein [Aquabacterium sp.]
MHTNPCPLLQGHTTLHLKATASKAVASLDFDSLLGLDYAQAWALHNFAVKVPASGVMRRALAVYVRHLEDISKSTTAATSTSTTEATAQALKELTALRRCCDARQTDAADQEQAFERVKAATTTQHLPSFAEVRHGPQQAAQALAFEEAHTRLVEQVVSSRIGGYSAKPKQRITTTDKEPQK